MSNQQRPPGDEPVANVPELDQEDLVFGEIFTGGDGENVASTDEGYEAVDGYQPRRPPVMAETAAAEVASLQLRDIGEASFGPPDVLPETVHGEDDRVRITTTDRYPWRAHASLRITAADDSLWIGTGWFVGPRLLVTAGHVVYIKNSGVPGRDGWVKSIVVIPGRNDNEQPFGTSTSNRFYSVKGWTESGDDEYDYGAIILTESLGGQTGWLGFASYANLDDVRGNIAGYPGDKPAGTQWYDARVIDSVSDRKVFYDIDTFGGQSGAAVYRIRDGQRHGFGIHAYGGARVNSATRINRHVFDNIKAWKDASEAS
jgi:glutamyl endopeptidase